MNRTQHILAAMAAVILLLAGIALGYWWAARPDTASMADAASSQEAGSQETRPGEREVLYWYDPMVPDQHFDKPGKSPFMDMMLVPRYADEAAGGTAISPGLRRSLGIRVAPVKRGRLQRTLTAPGTIAWDQRTEHTISVPVDGVVSRLHVKAPFEPVRAGQPLVNVLAPRWSVALAEAGALDRADSASARALRPAAQHRLRALGLPRGARARGDGSIVLTSPVTGVVTEIGVREGDAAVPGTMLLRVNGIGTVWLEAAVPQADVAGLRAGTTVQARVSALPGQTFDGEVEALLPNIDPSNRTQQARIVLDNPDGLLAPGMFAEVILQSERGDEVPLVPSDAIIGAGQQTHMIVLGEDDRFVPVAVRTGRSGDGRTEILSGLEGGEPVVVSGQFLIDSEASLSGALGRLTAGEGAKSGDPGKKQERKCEVEYWHDPMVPDQHFDKPGKSPFMDMMLVPGFTPESSPDCTIDDVEMEVPAATRPREVGEGDEGAQP